MSKQGQSNYKGINAQAWAAMSLFLQYLRYIDFSYIQLEASKFEDFNLVFNDGHKIICESKDWKKKFSFPLLRKTLDNILKKTTIGEKDEILIICSELNDDLRDKIRHIKYGSQFMVSEFKKKKFSDQQIAVLDKVKFWKVQQKDNHLIVYALFSELLNFWLPEDELECKADSILVKKIYEGSAKGEVYKRENIINEIESIRKKASKYSGYFDDERVKIEVQLQSLIKTLENNKSPEWAPNPLSALTSKPALMFFIFDRIKDKKIDKLQDWGDLWELYKIYRFSFSLFKIFEDNLHTEENKRYILQFFKDNISETRRFYQNDFFDINIVKIAKKILEDDKKNRFIEDTFEIVKKLITEKKDDIFYLKAQHDSSWERGEIAKLLKEIYLKANFKLKGKIYKLIVNTFNLIKDDGNFSHYTPKEIFDILEDYISLDFKNNFKKIVNIVINQYSDEFKKFNGWELMGTTSDRHFVGFVLEPAIRKYYEKSKNKKQAWDFLLQNCISKIDAKTKNKIIKKSVSKNRPDFLNRAVLLIVLERYKDKDKKISEEAFEILKEFILSKRGIPHKSDLIYQFIKNDSQISDDKKWKLIEVSINEYRIPVSVFVEEIVSDLTKKGNPRAKKVLKDWLKNPDYYKRFRFEINIIQSIRTIFDSDFEYAISLFEEFINSEYFINEQGHFESYKVAELFHDILRKDNKKGISIVKDIISKKKLSENQEILISYGLFNHDNKSVNDKKLLIRIYTKIIEPNLDKVYTKLKLSNARDGIVQFAERLVRCEEVSKALDIVEAFIKDSDPELSDDEHKKIEKGEEPHAITSVRGWCAWVLMKCAVPDGRKDINKIIELTKQLTEDENYYVQHMSCFALSQLARNRLSFINIDKKTLFLNDNTDKALEMAKDIEKMAFNLLRDISKKSDNVKKALAKSILTVFDRIKGLDEKDSLEFISLIRKFPPESIAEAAPLFIFFAEFRKNSFKDFKFKIPDLYDSLKPSKFDDKKFKKILKEVINKLEPKERVNFAINFEQIIRESDLKTVEGRKTFDIGYKYLIFLINEYNHNLFEMIYMTIKNGMEKQYKFNNWYNLYIKCLKKEKAFYDKNFKGNKTTNMYWWPSMYNKYILSSVFEQSGQKKFLDAFSIIVFFPKEMEIYDSEVVGLLEKIPKSNKDAKNIVKQLFDRNPSQYYELQKKWFDKK